MKIEEYIIQKIECFPKEFTIGICPYGKWGHRVKDILGNTDRDILCFDNNSIEDGVEKICELAKYDKICILYSCDNDSIYSELLEEVKKYKQRDYLVELFPRFTVGKHSYGPITIENGNVERIGAFCSFGKNSEVVSSHDVYISSHEFLSYPGEWEKHPGYVEGLKVKHPRFTKKTVIGNDVWVGKNATVIAGCNIGNGAIIGANSVVTKDVPDYAIVAGNPARIIRYRYKSKEIEILNSIEWWNWSDEKIIDNIDDFYLDISSFIEKHYYKEKNDG